jgi:hypothetical protein
VWLRLYGEELEADLAFRGHDLLDFYRGKMSARRLVTLVKGLPPDSATAQAARVSEPAGKPESAPERHLAPVRCLSDIPVARSLREVGRFVNASGDELAQLMGETG